MRSSLALVTFLSALSIALTACGDLPQPFYGNPGAQGALLAQPPPSRLAVPPPAQALLPDAAAATWAHAVADALVEQEIPADSRTPSPATASAGADWSLTLAADIRGAAVVPSFTILNPAGKPQGSTEGKPIPTAQWASGDPAILKASATEAAPGIAALLNRIDAARRQSDPNSLQNRPTRIYLAGLTGAPGDGDRSIPAQLRQKLVAAGIVVQDTARNADFEIRGVMATARGANGTIRIELQWIVSDARAERGRILQINEVDPRSVNTYWGDAAVAVATEAAGGVKQVIINASSPVKRDAPQPDGQKPAS